MKPKIEEVALDNISVFENGVTELAGRLIWVHPFEGDETKLWLRVVRRGTEDLQDAFCYLGPLCDNESKFNVQLDLNQPWGHREDVADVLDVYAVIRDSTGESIFRLSWPQANLPWMAYPTIYGNLSLKRSKRK